MLLTLEEAVYLASRGADMPPLPLMRKAGDACIFRFSPPENSIHLSLDGSLARWGGCTSSTRALGHRFFFVTAIQLGASFTAISSSRCAVASAVSRLTTWA